MNGTIPHRPHHYDYSLAVGCLLIRESARHLLLRAKLPTHIPMLNAKVQQEGERETLLGEKGKEITF